MTSALPYANGEIHIGHLVEYIQADIWARFQKMRGHECRFVCAEDAHGTPVMLRAEAEKIAPETLLARMQESHRRDFADFAVEFDNYHTTHSEENRVLSERIYLALKDKGLIARREIEQLFDPVKKMFLPDRFVRGDCPRCGAPDQYGDSCEKCGAAYSPTELKNPRSTVSGARPQPRRSEHLFFRLRNLTASIDEWVRGEVVVDGEKKPRLQPQAANKLREWLDSGLRDWDISRDAPYFGFRIPGEAAEKYFYVWLDAPVGYMASFQNLCAREGIDFDDFWRGEKTELYHFIGKDILYFHALFWPAMLSQSGYRTPTRLFAHGFLTVNGGKMSKSRGTFITARSYLEQKLDPEWLRYYYACKLNDKIEDLDLNLDDFVRRVNSDLVGKLVNIPSRVAGLLRRCCGGVLGESDDWIRLDADSLARKYEARRYGDAMFEIMRGAEEVNRRLEESRPWDLAKDDSKRDELAAVCSAALRAYFRLAAALAPATPRLAQESARLFGVDSLTWDDVSRRLETGRKIAPFRHLLGRVEKTMIDNLLAANRAPTNDAPAPVAAAAAAESFAPEVSLDDFLRARIVVARVVAADPVAGADKLLRLILDIGEARQRTVFAGIKAHYRCEDLVGRDILYLANLAPRKMRFGVSEGMALAAVGADGVLRLVSPDGEIAPGARLR